jgi:uncharacterized cupin superfamily protein
VRRASLLSDEFDDEQTRPGFRWRAVRVGRRIGGKRIGGTVYELEDGELTFPYHYHHGVEEWLYVVSGSPTLRSPAGENVLHPGDIVCFPADAGGAHSIRGPGRVMVLSANSSTSVVVYPDSDKVGTRPPDAGDRLNFRRGDAVGYWEGE